MKYLPSGIHLHTEAFLPALLDFMFYSMDQDRSPRQYFGDMQGQLVMSCSCVRQSSAVLLNFT